MKILRVRRVQTTAAAPSQKLQQELKDAIAVHRKTVAKFKKANLMVVREELPEIGTGDSGKKELFLGEIVVRGRKASYSVNTPTLKSVAKWTKKTSWQFDQFKGKPDEVVAWVIKALSDNKDTHKVDLNLKALEKPILSLLGDATSAGIRSGNVARLEYRSKSKDGKLLWVWVQAPREMTDMEGSAIKPEQAKKKGVTLKQILDYLEANGAQKPKRQKRSNTRWLYD